MPAEPSHRDIQADSITEADSEPASAPRVLAILPRGEALRNFVYSGALELVAERTHLFVLSVIPDLETRQLLAGLFPRVMELPDTQERYTVRLARGILDMAHGRWLWSAAARDRWARQNAEERTVDRRVKHTVKKALAYPFAWRGGLRLLSSVEHQLSHGLRSNDDLLRMLQRERIDFVFNGSHIHGNRALPVIHAAKHLRIPTSAFIFSWDNLTSQGRIIPSYDYYFVWTESIRQQLLQMYRPLEAERVIVTGTPQFDFHFQRQSTWSKQEFCQRVGADPARPLILYTTAQPHAAPDEPELVRCLARRLTEFEKVSRPQLLIRVYPKDRSGRFDSVARGEPDVLVPPIPWVGRFETPRIEDLAFYSNTLRHCDAGINIGSTVSLELCLFDKPVINIAYSPPGSEVADEYYERCYDFEHYRPVAQSGAVDIVRSEDQLLEAIRRNLAEPARAAEQRKALLDKMFGGMLDGQAGRRVAERLIELAERSASARHNRAAMARPSDGS